MSISPAEPFEDQERRPAAPARPPAGGPEGPWEPAKIKWFDKLRGFGFANVFGSADDVFIHMEVLRQSSISDLQAGEGVAVRIREGPRGRMVSEIKPWESARPGGGRSSGEAGRPLLNEDLPGGDDPE